MFSSGILAPRWGAINIPINEGRDIEVKVLFIREWENYNDEAKLKKYYEYLETTQPFFQKKHEGVKFKNLGGWAEQPGHVVALTEYESMEEFSKIWSDEEVQRELIKLARHVKNFRVHILRPTITAPPE